MQNKLLIFFDLLKGFSLAVCLFVCPLLFLTNTTQNPFIIQPLFLSISGGLFILVYSAEVYFKREINFRLSRIDFALFIFLFSSLLSLFLNYIFGDYKIALLNEFARKADYLIFGLIFGFLFAKTGVWKISFSSSSYIFLRRVLLWALLWLLWKIQASPFVAILIFAGGTYICYNHLKNYGVKELFEVLLATCFCACLYGLLQAVGVDLFWKIDISKEFGARPVSTFGNPNFLASFTLLFLPYSFVLFLKAKGRKDVIISAFFTLILALFLVLSGTRSAWVGILGAILIFLIFVGNFISLFISKSIKIIFLFFVFCVCFYGLNTGLKYGGGSTPQKRVSEVKKVFTLNNISLKGEHFIEPLHQRLMMWHCALQNFKSSPIIGKGINSFQLNFPFCQGNLIAQNPALDRIKMQANAAHNEYLEILSDGGLISFFAYLGIWIAFFAMSYKKIKTVSQEEKIFYLSLFFGLISVLFDNLFNITLRILLVSFAFWFVFSSLNNLSAKTRILKLNRAAVSVCLIFVFCLIYVLIFWQTKQFIAQKYELQGYKYLLTEDFHRGAETINKALNFSYARPEPFYSLVNTYIMLGDIEKAKEISETAVNFYPAFYEFYFRLAALYYANGITKEALDNLRRNLFLLPTYTPAAELFANILTNQKTVLAEDKILLESLVKVLPYQINLHSYLAEIYFKEGNCPQAKKIALQTLQENIFDKSSLNILTVCTNNPEEQNFIHKAERLNDLKSRLKIKQDMEILKDIKLFLSQNPDDTDANTLLAEFYFRQDKYCLASEILKQAKPNGNLNKAYNFSLSLALQKCGNFQESQSLLEDILYLDPYDELAKNRLKNVNI